MIKTHVIGFPRMGAQRELKFALERHWRGEIDAAALETVGAQLREDNGTRPLPDSPKRGSGQAALLSTSNCRWIDLLLTIG